MTLSLQIESFLYDRHSCKVKTIAKRFNVSMTRCLEELALLEAFGVVVTQEGDVYVGRDDGAIVDREPITIGGARNFLPGSP